MSGNYSLETKQVDFDRMTNDFIKANALNNNQARRRIMTCDDPPARRWIRRRRRSIVSRAPTRGEEASWTRS